LLGLGDKRFGILRRTESFGELRGSPGGIASTIARGDLFGLSLLLGKILPDGDLRNGEKGEENNEKFHDGGLVGLKYKGSNSVAIGARKKES
jgi:hypothetical protein